MIRRASCAAVIAAAMAVTTGPATAQDITVIRGTEVETVDYLPLETASAGPEVLRGRPAPPVSAPPEQIVDTNPNQIVPIAGGSTLWAANRQSRRIVACWRRGTGYVGGQQVVCTAP